MRQFGLVRLDGMLEVEQAEALRAHAEARLIRSKEHVAEGSAAYTDLFGAIMSRMHR